MSSLVDAIKKHAGERRLKASTKEFNRTLESQREDTQKGLKQCMERKSILYREEQRLKAVIQNTPHLRSRVDETLFLQRSKDNDRRLSKLTEDWKKLDRIHATTEDQLRAGQQLALVRAQDKITIALGQTTMRDKDLDDAEDKREDAKEVEDTIDKVHDMVTTRATTPDRLREREKEEEEKEKEKEETIFDGLANQSFSSMLHGVPAVASAELTPARLQIQRNEETERQLLALIEQLRATTPHPPPSAPPLRKKKKGKKTLEKEKEKKRE